MGIFSDLLGIPSRPNLPIYTPTPSPSLRMPTETVLSDLKETAKTEASQFLKKETGKIVEAGTREHGGRFGGMFQDVFDVSSAVAGQLGSQYAEIERSGLEYSNQLLQWLGEFEAQQNLLQHQSKVAREEADFKFKQIRAGALGELGEGIVTLGAGIGQKYGLWDLKFS